MLPNITKISVEYRPESKDIGPTFQFLRKYGADIKYHNPHLIIERLRTADGPIKLRMSVFQKGNNESIEVEPSLIDGVEKLRAEIENIGKAEGP